MSILIAVLASMVMSHLYIRMHLVEDLDDTFQEIERMLNELDNRMDVQKVHLANLETRLRQTTLETRKELVTIKEKVDRMDTALYQIMSQLED